MIYNYDTAATIDTTSIINNTYQENDTPTQFWSTVVNSAVTSANTAATGTLNNTTTTNNITAGVIGNSATLTTDLAKVEGAAELASVSIQENDTVKAFASVTGSSASTTVNNLAAASTATLSNNAISAAATLNSDTNTVSGTVDATFNSTQAGTASLLYNGVTANNEITADAGVLVASSQVNTTVGPKSVTVDDVTTTEKNLAEVKGDTIGLTVSGTTGAGLTLTEDANAISAKFTGNTATNALTVNTGEGTTLSSSAGIANLQVNNAVAPGTDGFSAYVDTSEISAKVTDNALTKSTLSFDGNSLAATATGSVSDNRLTVATGLNVAADGTQTNSLKTTQDAELASTAAGLFVSNVQIAKTSTTSAKIIDTTAANEASLDVDSRGLIDSSLTADQNTFKAMAVANDAYSSITVGGATTFTSTVAASNLQALTTSPVTAVAENGSLTVTVGTKVGALDTNNDITGSSVSVSKNEISSLAVGNRDPLLVSITGTTVSDGLTNTATNTAIPSASNATATGTAASTAGISAVSSQQATGSDAAGISATNTVASVYLYAGGFATTPAAGPYVANSKFTQSANTISSLANLNESAVGVNVKATTLDASTSVVAVQNGGTAGTTAPVTATTDGTIFTGVNAENSGVADPAGITILVGDENLTDTTETGNTIASTAGGNINSGTLAVAVTGTLSATAVINKDTATSSVVSLTATNPTANGEMTLLTDQTLDKYAVSATTNYSQIGGTLMTGTDALSSSKLLVDGNQVTATARGNLTTNSLSFSANVVDMTKAESGTVAEGTPAADTTAGTNLAVAGAMQQLSANSTVTAIINAGAANEIFGTIDAGTQGAVLADPTTVGTKTLTDVVLSVDGNAVESAATGNNATSTLSGTGGILSVDAPGTLAGKVAFGTDAVTVNDTAAANAVFQDTDGAVSASLATGAFYDIAADTVLTTDIKTSTIRVDSNRAVALATGSTAKADTTLAFTTQASSAATAVRQDQSGATTATVGGTGGVNITASTSPTAMDLISSTMSASSNTVGTEAIGATATTTLAAGNADTVSLVSGYADTAAAPSYSYVATVPTLSADYMLGVQQAISGITKSSADDMSVLVQTDNLQGSTLHADSNLLSARGIGGTSTATLSLTANDMAAATAANSVTGMLVDKQSLTAAVDVDLTSSDVAVKADDLNTAANTTNAADTITVSSNTLQAAGTGLSGVNTLTTSATAGISGSAVAAAITQPISTNTNSVTGVDRLLVSDQSVTADVTADANILNVYTAITGAVTGDSLKVDSNTMLAQGIGATSTNTLTTTAGTTLNQLTEAIVNSQSLAADVKATVTDSNVYSEVGGALTGSSLSVASNQIKASATGVSDTNSLTASGNAIVGVAAADTTTTTDTTEPVTGFTTTIASYQATTAVADTVATVTGADLTINPKAAVGTSTADLDTNTVQSVATAVSGTNTLKETATTSITDAPVLLTAVQNVDGTSDATNTTTKVNMTMGGAVTGSKLSVDSNTIQSLATGGDLTNSVELAAKTTITDTNSSINLVLLPASSQATTTDSALVARQVSEAAVSATVTTPEVSFSSGANGITADSAVSVSSNIIRSQATNLSASNTSKTAATTTLENTASAILAYQNVSDTTKASTSGAVVTATGGALTGTAAVNSNWLVASATGGTTTNSLNVSANSITGPAVANTDTLATTYNTLAALKLDSDDGWDPQNALLNVQTRDAAVTATLVDSSLANDAGKLGISASFAATTGTISVDSNLLVAEARGLVADNKVTLASDTSISGAGAVLGSTQFSSTDVTATINSGSTATQDDARITLTGTATLAGTASLDSNQAIAAATSNLAVNSLSGTAGSTMTNLGTETTTTLVAGTSIDVDGAGFAVQNVQAGTGATTASITNFDIESSVNELTSGTATVDSNTVQAVARGQAAQNSLVLNAGTALTGSASLANVQSNGGAINSTITTGTIGLTAPKVTGTVSVSNNKVQASGTANLALNSMDITGTLAAATGGSSSGTTTKADFTAVNSQTNTAGVTSEVKSYTLALNSGTSLTGTANMSNNAVLADATGNSAVNTFTINPTTSTTADFAFTGVQMNTGSISSSINGATIQLASTGSTGTFNNTGNQIGSVATGNVSVSTLSTKL